jgi:hypothetical protein
MDVSSISGSQSTWQTLFQQQKTDWQSLSNALQSGDLSGAQQAFSSLQNDRTQLKSLFQSQNGQNSSQGTLQTDLQNLATALKSGNLSDAQAAFATLQQDIKALKGGHHHHHHGGGVSGVSGTNGASTTLGVDTDGDNDGSGSTVGQNLNVTV